MLPKQKELQFHSSSSFSLSFSRSSFSCGRQLQIVKFMYFPILLGDETTKHFAERFYKLQSSQLPLFYDRVRSVCRLVSNRRRNKTNKTYILKKSNQITVVICNQYKSNEGK